jgi:predicted GNAT family N-acyltransferase
MAVIAARRGQGIGGRLVRVLLKAARDQGLQEVYLAAQVQAVDFYRGFGFAPEGEVFMEAGIPHRRMRRPL